MAAMARQIPYSQSSRTSAPSANGPDGKLNTEELGQQLLRLLETLRVHSLSLHRSDGELLWLSEGVFGPDEHGYVLDALDVFLLEAGRQHLERRLEDGRRALFLCARTPLGDRCGLALAIVEERSTQAIDVELSAPRVIALMRRFSMLLAPPLPPPQVAAPPAAASAPARPPAAAAAAAAAPTPKLAPAPESPPAAKVRPAATASSAKASASDAAAAVKPATTAAVAAAASAATAATAAASSANGAGQPRPPGIPPGVVIPTISAAVRPAAARLSSRAAQRNASSRTSSRTSARAAPPSSVEAGRSRSSVLTASAASAAATEISPIHARLYVRLRSGGATRRFEVTGLPQVSVSGEQALAERVIEHLQRMREHYRQAPASFAIPLHAESVSQRGFMSQLRPALQRARLSPGTLGFCLPLEAWSEQTPATEQFIADCAQCGCFVTLDDFTLGRSGFELLRSGALRCLKLDAQLIGSVMSDKFAQATVAAIVQATRVLGLYCVAKQVASTPLAQWLAAAGVEFSDGVSRAETGGATTKSEEALSLAETS
jgi:EAL domain-containing protein (putative c-di-GMP-specific phosphodiesterase class I)